MKRIDQKQVKSTDNEANRMQASELFELTHNESSDAGEEYQLAHDDDEITYKCGDCGAVLNVGLSPCPVCGAKLDWSQV